MAAVSSMHKASFRFGGELDNWKEKEEKRNFTTVLSCYHVFKLDSSPQIGSCLSIHVQESCCGLDQDIRADPRVEKLELSKVRCLCADPSVANLV